MNADKDILLGTEVMFRIEDGSSRDGKVVGKFIDGKIDGDVRSENLNPSSEKKQDILIVEVASYHATPLKRIFLLPLEEVELVWVGPRPGDLGGIYRITPSDLLD